MRDDLAFAYRKSHITRVALAIFLVIVFISILLCPAVVSAVVDVTLAWDANTELDLKGYKNIVRLVLLLPRLPTIDKLSL